MLRALAVCFVFLSPHLLALDPVYKPLALYNGSWTSHDRKPGSGDSITNIVNVCGLVGRFYGCQQIVNGKEPSLILFLPSGPPGHYYTHAMSPELRAYGRGDLQIEGDRWTYSSTSEENGKTVYYRTVNVFSGPDRIHFEVAQSPDNQAWTVKLSGDEVRTSPPRR